MEPYWGWDVTELRREIGRLHTEMSTMAVLTEIDRAAIEQLRAELAAAEAERDALREALDEWIRAFRVHTMARQRLQDVTPQMENALWQASCNLEEAYSPSATPAVGAGRREKEQAVIEAATERLRILRLPDPDDYAYEYTEEALTHALDALNAAPSGEEG